MHLITYFSSKILIINLTSYPSGKYLPYIKYANVRLFICLPSECFYEFLFLRLAFHPHLHPPSFPTRVDQLFVWDFVCSVILEEEGTVLIWSCVWSEISVLKNLSKESYLSHLSSKTAACWFLLRLSKSLLGHFYPIMFYGQNHFNTVRQERLEESLFASKINCFHQNLPQMHVGVWFECTAPPPWPQALPERNPCPAAPHNVLLSSTEERLQQKEQMFKNVASASCSYVYLVLLTARFLFLINKEKVSTQAPVH